MSLSFLRYNWFVLFEHSTYSLLRKMRELVDVRCFFWFFNTVCGVAFVVVVITNSLERCASQLCPWIHIKILHHSLQTMRCCFLVLLFCFFVFSCCTWCAVHSFVCSYSNCIRSWHSIPLILALVAFVHICPQAAASEPIACRRHSKSKHEMRITF